MIFLTGAAAEAVSAEVTGAEVTGAEVITQVAEPVQETLNILDLAVKGGWIMIVLAILSILGIYIFVERFMTLRKAMQKNPYLLDRINDNLRDNDPKSAMNYCERMNTPMSRILVKGVKDSNLDLPSLRQVLENNAALEIAALEKGLPILSTIAAVAPMLGFLGTVTGMVQAFWEMSNWELTERVCHCFQAVYMRPWSRQWAVSSWVSSQFLPITIWWQG